MKTINIVYCTDDNYAEPCCVSMASVLANTNEKISFYIVYKQLSEMHKTNIEALKGKFNNAEIEFVEFKFDIPNEFILTGLSNSTIEVYFRLWFGELFTELNRIIFFDCDVIVRGNIEELWGIDLEGKAVGAITDITSYRPAVAETLSKAGFERTYFCAGVLLIDLDKYRSLQIPKRSIELVPLLIERNRISERNFLCDQDILNDILSKTDNIKLLHPKFQFQDNNYVFNNQLDFELVSLDEWAEAFRNPVVVHFNASRKPWVINSTFQAAYLWKDYFKYKYFTVFYDADDEKRILEYERRCKETLLPFDIINRKTSDYSFHFWRELLDYVSELIKQKACKRKLCYWGQSMFTTQFMAVIASNCVYPDIIVDGLIVNQGKKLDKWTIYPSESIRGKADEYYVVSFVSNYVPRNEMRNVMSEYGFTEKDYTQIFDIWDENANKPLL